MGFDIDYLLYAVFAFVVGFVAYQFATKGIRGLLFGGKLGQTYGEVALERRGMLTGFLKVHKVCTAKGDKVGIEIIYRTAFRHQLVPATLNKDEARRLIQLLTQATNEN